MTKRIVTHGWKTPMTFTYQLTVEEIETFFHLCFCSCEYDPDKKDGHDDDMICSFKRDDDGKIHILEGSPFWTEINDQHWETMKVAIQNAMQNYLNQEKENIFKSFGYSGFYEYYGFIKVLGEEWTKANALERMIKMRKNKIID